MKTTKAITTIKIIAFQAMLLCNLNLQATNEKKVNSKVDKAIVFLQGAQLFSTADFTISPGTTDLIFDAVSPYIDAQSLQATGSGNIIILDVRHNIKYPEAIPLNEKIKPKNLNLIKAAEDSLVVITWFLEDISEKRNAFNTEKNTLLNNRLIKGETKRDSLALLKDALEYLRIRLQNLNSELSKLKRDEYRAEISKQRIEQRIAEMKEENRKNGEENPVQKKGATNQVIVTVSSAFALTTNININYFVRNAGWSPSYDLRATSANTNLKLDHKANVYQSSGIDWNDVSLTLSTGTPNQGSNKPELTANYLNYYVPYSYNYSGSPAPRMEVLSATDSRKDDLEYDKKQLAKTSADFTVVVENPIRVEYEIKLNYNIPSDSQTHTVMIQTKEVSSNFVYSAIPKLDPNAFLVAKVTDWESMNLIPGPGRIYFDGAFMGETNINPMQLEDTLELNMGRDKSIMIERKKLKDKSKTKTFNNDKVLTYTYEITVRNTKSGTINLSLEDQIPVSQNEEIKVELLESSQAKLDEASGRLSWNLNLKSKEVRKISITYEIKYPKNKQLAGL